jgi:hypothetical protein
MPKPRWQQQKIKEIKSDSRKGTEKRTLAGTEMMQ